MSYLKTNKLIELLKTGAASNLLGQLEKINGTNHLAGLNFFPLNLLTFNVSPPVEGSSHASVSCAISMENKMEERVYFRFKTNKRTRYVFEPSEGILRPRSVMTIWATVDPVYITYLLNSGHAGVLRGDDAILVSLIKLKHRFCQMYDALEAANHKFQKLQVVEELGHYVRRGDKVASWHKWLCTYVVSEIQPVILPNTGQQRQMKPPRVSYGNTEVLARRDIFHEFELNSNDIHSNITSGKQQVSNSSPKHSISKPSMMLVSSWGKQVIRAETKVNRLKALEKAAAAKDLLPLMDSNSDESDNTASNPHGDFSRRRQRHRGRRQRARQFKSRESQDSSSGTTPVLSSDRSSVHATSKSYHKVTIKTNSSPVDTTTNAAETCGNSTRSTPRNSFSSPRRSKALPLHRLNDCVSRDVKSPRLLSPRVHKALRSSQLRRLSPKNGPNSNSGTNSHKLISPNIKAQATISPSITPVDLDTALSTPSIAVSSSSGSITSSSRCRSRSAHHLHRRRSRSSSRSLIDDDSPNYTEHTHHHDHHQYSKLHRRSGSRTMQKQNMRSRSEPKMRRLSQTGDTTHHHHRASILNFNEDEQIIRRRSNRSNKSNGSKLRRPHTAGPRVGGQKPSSRSFFPTTVSSKMTHSTEEIIEGAGYVVSNSKNDNSILKRTDENNEVHNGEKPVLSQLQRRNSNVHVFRKSLNSKSLTPSSVKTRHDRNNIFVQDDDPELVASLFPVYMNHEYDISLVPNGNIRSDNRSYVKSKSPVVQRKLYRESESMTEPSSHDTDNGSRSGLRRSRRQRRKGVGGSHNSVETGKVASKQISQIHLNSYSPRQCKVMFEFNARDESELTVQRGEVLMARLHDGEPGWAIVDNGGSDALVPADHLSVLKMP